MSDVVTDDTLDREMALLRLQEWGIEYDCRKELARNVANQCVIGTVGMRTLEQLLGKAEYFWVFPECYSVDS